MNKLFTTTVLAASLAFSGAALAQDDDDDGTIRLENVTILDVIHVDFKPGQREAAMTIIDDYFIKATEVAGLPGPVVSIHFDTGKWDAIWAWVMPGGYEDLMWYRSPDDIKWFAALAEITGSEEAAQAKWEEYISKVASAYREVAHVHNEEEAAE